MKYEANAKLIGTDQLVIFSTVRRTINKLLIRSTFFIFIPLTIIYVTFFSSLSLSLSPFFFIFGTGL